MATIRRLQREYQELIKNSAYPITLIGDSLFKWQVKLVGNLIEITFPQNYPFKPPKVRFTPPIRHANVDATGYLCLRLLADQWHANINIHQLILIIVELLS